MTVGPGQKKTFSYGGETIEVAYLAPGRTAYAKRNSITPGGVIRLNDGKLYDGQTLAPLGSLTVQDGRASYNDEAFFTLDSAGNLSKHTLGGKVTKVGGVAGAIGSNCRFGQGEGTQSYDDNEWIINDGGDDNAGEVEQSYAYLNVKTGKVVTRNESQILGDSNKLYQNGAHHVDYVSMSLLGKIVAYVKGNASRWVLYDAGFKNPRKIGDPHTRAAHATFFIGENGEDMMLNAHWDAFVIVDLDDPSTVYALTWGGHGHFSPNFARKGFVASFVGGETRTGTFSKSWFPTSGSRSSKDKSYLGLHYRADGPHEMVADLACDQVNNEYINTALAVASHDGKMVFATVQDRTTIYTVRIRAL